MLNVLDLFSGAGGLTEGFRSESFNLLAHVEMDGDACQTLQLRDIFSYLKKVDQLDQYYSYITGKLTWAELVSVVPKEVYGRVVQATISENSIDEIIARLDVLVGDRKIDGIIGGPPCQAYSTVARSRNEAKKSEDERVYLYKFYVRFLEHFKPDFFVFENVKGLYSFKDVDGKKLLPKIKYDFSHIFNDGTENFDIDERLINSADFGVSQTRERIIIFGRRNKFRPIHFFESLDNLRERGPVLRQLFRDLPELNAGNTVNHYGSLQPIEFVKKYFRENDPPLTQNIARPNRDDDLEIYRIAVQKKMEGENLKYNQLPDRLVNHRAKDIFLDRFKALDGDGYSHTVVAHIAKDGHLYIHYDLNQNRSITVREAARIQSFPDNFYFEHSRTAAFRQIGNAVPPYLSKKFAFVISQFDKKLSNTI
ncbi:DNA cytosine methyltransferase [Lacticaseibacillus porcinae]|uniref:DNA cytosine methyltransferase n=1 Tax=Lacticaseibacillus porcinae TaxID=1123687 RepID=UPI000F7AC1C6|nr:DNA cytosine methyltransferase [Lacticaseibacillus porcinae]